MPKSITLFPNQNRLQLYTGAMLLLLVVSVLVMFNLERVMHRDLRLLALIFGFLGVTIFGYGLLYNIFRLRSSKPLLHADIRGLEFHTSPLNQGALDWSDIKEYGLVKHGTRKVVLIFLHEPQKFLLAQRGLSKRIYRSNMKRYQTPVALPVGLFPEDPVKVMKRLSGFGKG